MSSRVRSNFYSACLALAIHIFIIRFRICCYFYCEDGGNLSFTYPLFNDHRKTSAATQVTACSRPHLHNFSHWQSRMTTSWSSYCSCGESFRSRHRLPRIGKRLRMRNRIFVFRLFFPPFTAIIKLKPPLPRKATTIF